MFYCPTCDATTSTSYLHKCEDGTKERRCVKCATPLESPPAPNQAPATYKTLGQHMEWKRGHLPSYKRPTDEAQLRYMRF